MFLTVTDQPGQPSVQVTFQNGIDCKHKRYFQTKVFASRFGCGHMSVGYTSINYKYNFLAVYAAATQSAANTFLAAVNWKISEPEYQKDASSN